MYVGRQFIVEMEFSLAFAFVQLIDIHKGLSRGSQCFIQLRNVTSRWPIITGMMKNTTTAPAPAVGATNTPCYSQVRRLKIEAVATKRLVVLEVELSTCAGAFASPHQSWTCKGPPGPPTNEKFAGLHTQTKSLPEYKGRESYRPKLFISMLFVN